MEGANIASPLLTASIQYILNVALTFPAILYLDRFGRRPSLLIGSFLMMTLLFTVGALQASYGIPNVAPYKNASNSDITWIIYNNPPVSKAVVAMTYLFVCSFATTWGPTSWTYPSEIYPTKIRAKAVSLSTASNWFWNCVLAFGVPPLLTNSKRAHSLRIDAYLELMRYYLVNWKMYMIFATFNGAAFIHMFLTAPETKGKTLEEMDEVFDSGLPAWKSVPQGSRLDQLQKDIEAGTLKVTAPFGGGVHGEKEVPVPETADHVEGPADNTTITTT